LRSLVDDIAGWVSSLPGRWTEGCAPEVFAGAREAYASAGRFHHTWGHVLDCVEKLSSFPDSGRAVFLALLFHDAVYVPGRKDNEARSAALASDVLRRYASLEPGDCRLSSG
jgi:predicted metal-dependent HD superfamily phosphohydrolase